MKTIRKNQFLRSSREPLEDLKKLAYPGQPINMRLYREGYEQYMDAMPLLECCNDTLEEDLAQTNVVMKQLAKAIEKDGWTQNEFVPAPGKFNRTILAIQEPVISDTGITEMAELVVAQWGDGHSSPIHGHADGYLLEEVLHGKLLVNTYRIVDLGNRIVRPHQTKIVTKGTLIALYTKPIGINDRRTLVHNFTSIGYTATLHYLPEHTRDGRDNGFFLEVFSDNYTLNSDNVQRITAQDGMHLQNGEVVLVRSSNVPEYGDHFIVVTGHPVMKEHGLRVQDEAVMASSQDTLLLDQYEPQLGLTLLKLKPEAREAFHDFHGITMQGREVVFPQI